MKFKAIVFTAAIAAVAVSVASASPPPGKGKNGAGPTDASAPACGPTVSYVLNGTFVAAGADSFTLTVSHANKHGLKAGKNATVYVDASTKVSRNGAAATLADLAGGDRLNVQARACKNADAATLQLTAKRVNAHAPSADADEPAPAATAPAPTAP